MDVADRNVVGSHPEEEDMTNNVQIVSGTRSLPVDVEDEDNLDSILCLNNVSCTQSTSGVAQKRKRDRKKKVPGDVNENTKGQEGEKGPEVSSFEEGMSSEPVSETSLNEATAVTRIVPEQEEKVDSDESGIVEASSGQNVCEDGGPGCGEVVDVNEVTVPARGSSDGVTVVELLGTDTNDVTVTGIVELQEYFNGGLGQQLATGDAEGDAGYSQDQGIVITDVTDEAEDFLVTGRDDDHVERSFEETASEENSTFVECLTPEPDTHACANTTYVLSEHPELASFDYDEAEQLTFAEAVLSPENNLDYSAILQAQLDEAAMDLCLSGDEGGTDEDLSGCEMQMTCLEESGENLEDMESMTRDPVVGHFDAEGALADLCTAYCQQLTFTVEPAPVRTSGFGFGHANSLRAPWDGHYSASGNTMVIEDLGIEVDDTARVEELNSNANSELKSLERQNLEIDYLEQGSRGCEEVYSEDRTSQSLDTCKLLRDCQSCSDTEDDAEPLTFTAEPTPTFVSGVCFCEQRKLDVGESLCFSEETAEAVIQRFHDEQHEEETDEASNDETFTKSGCLRPEQLSYTVHPECILSPCGYAAEVIESHMVDGAAEVGLMEEFNFANLEDKTDEVKYSEASQKTESIQEASESVDGSLVGPVVSLETSAKEVTPPEGQTMVEEEPSVVLMSELVDTFATEDVEAASNISAVTTLLSPNPCSCYCTSTDFYKGKIEQEPAKETIKETVAQLIEAWAEKKHKEEAEMYLSALKEGDGCEAIDTFKCISQPETEVSSKVYENEEISQRICRANFGSELDQEKAVELEMSESASNIHEHHDVEPECAGEEVMDPSLEKVQVLPESELSDEEDISQRTEVTMLSCTDDECEASSIYSSDCGQEPQANDTLEHLKLSHICNEEIRHESLEDELMGNQVEKVGTLAGARGVVQGVVKSPESMGAEPDLEYTVEIMSCHPTRTHETNDNVEPFSYVEASMPELSPEIFLNSEGRTEQSLFDQEHQHSLLGTETNVCSENQEPMPTLSLQECKNVLGFVPTELTVEYVPECTFSVAEKKTLESQPEEIHETLPPSLEEDSESKPDFAAKGMTESGYEHCEDSLAQSEDTESHNYKTRVLEEHGSSYDTDDDAEPLTFTADPVHLTESQFEDVDFSSPVNGAQEEVLTVEKVDAFVAETTKQNSKEADTPVSDQDSIICSDDEVSSAPQENSLTDADEAEPLVTETVGAVSAETFASSSVEKQLCEKPSFIKSILNCFWRRNRVKNTQAEPSTSKTPIPQSTHRRFVLSKRLRKAAPIDTSTVQS